MPSLPSTELVEEPKALLIYHTSFYGEPQPQKILDIEMYRYQCEQQRIPVIQEHELKGEEVFLPLKELERRYPCVNYTNEAKQ